MAVLGHLARSRFFHRIRRREGKIWGLALPFAKKAGKPIQGIATATLEQLVAYHWPGNVRELENLIERGVVLSGGPTLDLHAHLPHPPVPPSPRPREVAPAIPLDGENGATSPGADSPSALEEVERRHILVVLERTGWVIEGGQGAAQLLNLTPSTLRSRMKKLGIRRAPA